MKAKALFFLICGYFYGYAQEVHLNANTKTLLNKKIIFCLVENNGMNLISKDTLTFRGKTLFIKKKINQPSCLATFSIHYKGKQLYTRFVIDSGKQTFSLNLDEKSQLGLKITDLNTDSYQIYNNLSKMFFNNLYLHRKEINKVNANTLSAAANKRFLIEELNYLQKNPNNFYALIALYQASKSETDVSFTKNVLQTLSKFNDTLKSSKLGQQILTEQTYKINAILNARGGNKASTFIVKEANGNLFDSSSLKGQNYVIAFSATWCIPCQQQLPKLKKVYDTYKAKGLKVIYFNDDDNLVKWKEHIKNFNLDWINVSERLKAGKGKISKSFGVYAIPTYLIINKDGFIVYNSDENDINLEKFEKFIKSLFDNK